MQTTSDYLVAYIGYLRAAYQWFHSAHHVTRGVGFYGDHIQYSEIYQDYLVLVDGATEKALGLTNDENVANPLATLQIACDALTQYPVPTSSTSLGIATTALQIEKDYIALVEELFAFLEESDCLSLGLNDFLAATANQHETFVYKLQQRIKSQVQD